ncbi:MAG: flippase-like domain-containing protein [Crocinitomicaceae bacterium]|nr:flippase-like domain-containing protein [Crocinitomicaceae bacterium]MCF8433404.1 flippase-like domain-containing protein [Crocinitomicaceae bacterium]
MQKAPIVQKSFSSWKIKLAILLGVGISLWMLYRGISEERFIPVENKSGDYNWIDANGDGNVNSNLSAEFIAVPKGDYVKQTFTYALSAIRWNSKTFLWLGVALLFMVGRDFFYMLRIRLLTKKELTWKSSFSVIMLWEFASALSPGVVGGAAVAMFILKREKIALGRSTAIVLITTLFDNLFYIILIPFVFLFIGQADLFPTETAGSLTVQYVFWIGFSVILFLSLFLFTAIFIAPQLAGKLLVTICRLPFLTKWRDRATKTGEDIVLAATEFKKENLFYWIKLFLITCGSWISRYLVINAVLQAFLVLGFMDHILILGKQLVLWLFMLISPTPGASGVAEYAFGELLSGFSESALLLATMAIIWRLISYFPYLFIGAVMLPRWLGKKNKG